MLRKQRPVPLKEALSTFYRLWKTKTRRHLGPLAALRSPLTLTDVTSSRCDSTVARYYHCETRHVGAEAPAWMAPSVGCHVGREAANQRQLQHEG